MIEPKSRKSNKQLVGYMMYGAAVILPLTQLPQIKLLFTTKVTTGLSLITWVMVLVFGTIPLVYALTRRLQPLIISNALSEAIALVIIYGILRYSQTASAGTAQYQHLLMLNNLGKGLTAIGILFASIGCAFIATDLINLEVKTHRKRS